MKYGGKISDYRESLEHWAESLERSQRRGSSKILTGSDRANDTNKTTGGPSRSGGPSFGIHEEFDHLDDYFSSSEIDRHYTHLFGDEWRDHTGRLYELHWVSSSGEFIVISRDKEQRPRGFVLQAYCPTFQIARLEVSPWVREMYRDHSLLRVIDFIERNLPA